VADGCGSGVVVATSGTGDAVVVEATGVGAAVGAALAVGTAVFGAAGVTVATLGVELFREAAAVAVTAGAVAGALTVCRLQPESNPTTTTNPQTVEVVERYQRWSSVTKLASVPPLFRGTKSGRGA